MAVLALYKTPSLRIKIIFTTTTILVTPFETSIIKITNTVLIPIWMLTTLHF